MPAGLLTPRAAPPRLLPALGGTLVLLLALPVFLIADWRVAGWALAAVLWVGAHALDVLARAQTGNGNLAASVQVFALLFKLLGLLVVLFAAAAASAELAVAAALTYALAFTFELGLSLAAYYGGTA